MPLAARPLETQFTLLDLRPLRPAPAPLPAPESPTRSTTRDEVRSLCAALSESGCGKVIEASALMRALERTRRSAQLPTAIPAFDALLGGGLPRGHLVELAGRRSTGRFSIVLAALAAATSMGEAAALIDAGDHFDPQVAEADGIDLRRLLWVRPKSMKEAAIAADLLAKTGFQLVVLDAGIHPVRGRRLADAVWVRLARTAESHGTALLVSAPFPLSGTASEALVVADRAEVRWKGRGRSPRILAGAVAQLRLEKHRRTRPGAQSKLALEVLP